MNCFLIDFENVAIKGFQALRGIKKGDRIVVFYSDNCKSITLDELNTIYKLKLEYDSFNVKVGSKNALDFQLVTYLGYIIGKKKRYQNYYIVSNDNGFEAVADFWRNHNVSVSCVPLKEMDTPVKTNVQIKTNNPTLHKPSKKSSAKSLITLNEIEELIGDNNDAATVMSICNSNKTKLAICNGLSKHFKDSKRAGAIYKKLKPLLKAKHKL